MYNQQTRDPTIHYEPLQCTERHSLLCKWQLLESSSMSAVQYVNPNGRDLRCKLGRKKLC